MAEMVRSRVVATGQWIQSQWIQPHWLASKAYEIHENATGKGCRRQDERIREAIQFSNLKPVIPGECSR